MDQQSECEHTKMSPGSKTLRHWYYQMDLAILPPAAQLLFSNIKAAKGIASLQVIANTIQA
jgi:hypothetical protein